MTKREVVGREAGIIDAILRDCGNFYPDDHLEWARDSKRVHQAFISRGWGFLTLDLPQLADHLLQGLAAERLPIDTPTAFGRRRSNRDHRPRIFHGLWKRLFDEDGLLHADPDETAIFLLLTICSVWKKAEIPCDPKREQKVYEEYFRIEEAMGPAPSFWDGDHHLISREYLGVLSDFVPHGADNSPELSGLLEDCQRVCDILVSELGPLEKGEIVGKHGPGAVSDLRRGADKFAFPTWSDRLEAEFPFFEHGTLNESWLLEDSQPIWIPSPEEGISYLTDVPKTQKGPRLIAEEPTSAQWMQQAVADALRNQVGATSLGVMIDFFSQTPSQDACRRASVRGSSATIDLSSASDRISCSLVQRVFRANWSFLKAFSACRTRFLRQDRFEHLPSISRLRKFASMGSALTFPVQSIVFACLAVGVGYHRQPHIGLRRLLRQVRVFGDDIIVPTTWVDELRAVLTVLGLKVNDDKSFSTGLFRESCGLYAYRGYDVTPFRVSHPFSDANGAIRASWAKGASNAFTKGLWHTSLHMEKVVFGTARPLCTPYGAPQVGLPTFSRGLDPRARVRWDKDIQEEVVASIAFKQATTRKPSDTGPNTVTMLGRRVFRDQSAVYGRFEPPRSRGELYPIDSAVVGGPGMIVRTWVPRRFITDEGLVRE